MNKAELVEEVAGQVDLTKRVCREAIDAITSTITDSLARGEKVMVEVIASIASLHTLFVKST